MTPLTSLWDLSLFFRELRCVNILVGWKMEVRQTFLAGAVDVRCPPKAEVTSSNLVGRANQVNDLLKSSESARRLDSP
jgi:hypothetical protein